MPGSWTATATRWPPRSTSARTPTTTAPGGWSPTSSSARDPPTRTPPTRPPQGREHVLGTGRGVDCRSPPATVRRPVATLLDLGRRLRSADAARLRARRRADRHRRLGARAGAGPDDVRALRARREVLAGPWWEPVAGRRFDQVVCNPPFVPGPPEIEHVYRDAGLGGDGASAAAGLDAARPPRGGRGRASCSALVARHPARRRGRPGGGRLARRLGRAPPAMARRGRGGGRPGGLDAWVVQRDVADPALHVGTWLRDAGARSRPPPRAGRARHGGSTSSPSTTSSRSGSVS